MFIGLAGLTCGCTSLQEYVQNGFKVGPNYGRPPAPVAKEWIDANDKRVRSESDDLSAWWTVFKDPALSSLICRAYQQNLTLRQAGFRVLEARAQLLIDAGNLFPQTQQMTGDYTRSGLSRETANARSLSTANRWFSQWDYGFNLSWELDFWGRFRRAIESDSATLDASVENYDDVLVTLLGDVATNYVNLRTFEQRIKYAEKNVDLQQETVKIAKAKVKNGVVSELDLDQAQSILYQTQAQIQELEIGMRQASNQLCILLGIPPQELQKMVGPGPIPTAPPEVAAGIPADLVRRRPDVRRAERQVAAQSAQIGVAKAEFYPHIAINGTFGYSAALFKDLFREKAFTGDIGPTFHWNILNYGRLVNNVRLQDARFQELVATYQNSVLTAAQDVENGLVTFLRASRRAAIQAESVKAATKAYTIGKSQYDEGTIELTPLILLEQNLVPQQDTLAQAQGEIDLGLIQVYRALGGGWEIRVNGCEPGPLPPPGIGSEPQPGAAKEMPKKDTPQPPAKSKGAP
jgi:NodT family efflux transporter outer membrane factor (OMF) lipoprotein